MTILIIMEHNKTLRRWVVLLITDSSANEAFSTFKSVFYHKTVDCTLRVGSESPTKAGEFKGFILGVCSQVRAEF